MDSRKPNRRGFLKDGVALAGLAAGSVQRATGQIQGTPAKKIDELIAYGERSPFRHLDTRACGRETFA